MPRFGAHLSVAPYRPKPKGRSRAAARSRRKTDGDEDRPEVSGPAAALARARDTACECVQLFLRPNRQWRAARLTEADVEAFRAEAETPRGKHGPICPIVGHAAYLINIASPPGRRRTGGSGGRGQAWPRRDVRALSIRALKDEVRRAAMLGVPYVVLHPGNHMGDGKEVGLSRVVEALDEVLGEAPDEPVKILLETTAGQGTTLGARLEELAFIIDHSRHADRLGMCADTCHMFAAGYDLASAEGYKRAIAEIDRTVGLARLAVWHVNDCLRECGSRVDRHTHIGRGRIGREGFRRLATDPRFAAHPMILETPKEDDAGREMDPVNLRLLRRLAREG